MIPETDKPTTEKNTTNASILEPLDNYFHERPEIIAAYLYGSFAKGTQTSHSDVDIALHTDPFENRITSFHARVRYQRELSDTLKKQVDVVFLQEAGEMLAYQILKNGNRIFERDKQKHRAYIAIRIIQCLDFQHLQERMQKGMIKAMRRESSGQ